MNGALIWIRPRYHPKYRFAVYEWVIGAGDLTPMNKIICDEVHLCAPEMAWEQEGGVDCYIDGNFIGCFHWPEKVFYDSTKLQMEYVKECRRMFFPPLDENVFIDLKGRELPKIWNGETKLKEEDE